MQDVIKLFKYPELLVYSTDNDSIDLLSPYAGNFACVYFNFQGKSCTLSIVYPSKILISPIDFRIGYNGEIESFPVEDKITEGFINYSETTLDKLKDIIYNCYKESVLNAKNFLVKLKKDDINKDFT